MVRTAERYPWSSAAAHCGLRKYSVLTQKLKWRKQFDQIANWSAWLVEGEDANQLSVLRRNIDKGLPCGTETGKVNREGAAISSTRETKEVG